MNDAKKIAAELEWLKKHPEFEERPATLREFLGPGYLDIESRVRKRILSELEAVFGDEVTGDRMTQFPIAMITGGIGIGKTTVASIVLPYMAHWVLCLRDPQGFFGLLPGSRIAFMQMSTSEKQALEVVFGDIKARIQHADWFVNKYPYDPKFTNQLRFPKDVWIIPGDSLETTFEGYNILGGILDEADSHKVTPNKDYAEQGYDTIANRISSRFGDRGFLLVIGQMKKATGFAARKFEELKTRKDAYVVRMAIWDSMGDDHYRCKQRGPHLENMELAEGEECGSTHKFFYDTFRKRIVSDEVAQFIESEHLIQIPSLYKREFEVNPQKALRDLAGIPPAVGDPFISLADKIVDCRDRWIQRYSAVDGESPVDPEGRFAKWFIAPDKLKRAVHLDIAYSANGDALGLAMGHVPELVEIEGELKPYIVFDFLLRIKAAPGSEIFLNEIRRIIYMLRDERKYNIIDVTMDGFQSTDTMQQLKKRRYRSEYLSVDRQVLPYHDLRDAIYEERVDFPPYVVRMNADSVDYTEIAVKELTELVDAGNKVDHPEGGSKDVADCMAGVAFTLMGNSRTYAKKVVSLNTARQQSQQRLAAAAGGLSHPAMLGDSGLSAPLPPSNWR